MSLGVHNILNKVFPNLSLLIVIYLVHDKNWLKVIISPILISIMRFLLIVSPLKNL